ncbi:MAG: hypothetical protein SP4CHLAM5_04730 [Chlamydiia bacterium]|nr:hypothetical protein [Chlamydiia bacterium]MCH9618344.1 hypothetical protein [Chlamydiia bacterium]MCH9624234.1 hypothetical protein [Chlamydiia bacterium]
MRYFILFLIPYFLFADTGLDPDLKQKPGAPKGPWLTGPIITTSAYTVSKGHFNFEPYVYFTDSTGFYNSRGHVHRSGTQPKAINSVELLQLGINDWIDLNLYPQFTYNYGVGERTRIGMGDLSISPTFQLWRDDPKFHMTTCKIGLTQLFPCGKFENLDPSYNGTDGLGEGGWSTTLFVAMSREFHLRKENFIVARAAISTIFFSPLDVHGLNFHGGDATTNGTLERGISVVVDLAFEITLSLHWALALDMENVYSTGSTFKGTTIEPVGRPEPGYLLSFAPAIEYNFTKNVGLIAGVWMSAYGAEEGQFINGVIALNIYM